MAGVNAGIKFTYKDYRNLPESETKRYELINGEIIMVPAPAPYHQRISGNLEHILREFVQSFDLGSVYHAPCNVVLSEKDVVQPDIFFISKQRAEIITQEDIKGAPDLIIEILSPFTAQRDRTYKRTLYARSGVKEYWIVDPDKKEVEVMRLKEQGFDTIGFYKKDTELKSPLLEGISINLQEIFK